MSRPLFSVVFSFFFFIHIHCTRAQKGKPSNTWLTLDGSQPVVIARGGYSGIFPDSSRSAFQFAMSTSLPAVILFCDLQLTKDGQGFCQTSLQLDNSTTIASVFPKGQKTYTVNGHDLPGWFPSDYTFDQLSQNVSLTQNIYSRTNLFDGYMQISAVEDVISLKPHEFWLNVQYASFYAQRKLDPALYVEMALRILKINYISSPEVGFLKTLNLKVNKAKTKLVFRFLETDIVEPTTNQTYGSLVKNLSAVTSFASGILVPKGYIWPVSKDMYLKPATALVAHAHKQGLQVYASDFANDILASYNYSYDPTDEYLQFIDNSRFSVDGVLTDFPSTASESVACLAHNQDAIRPAKGSLIISHNGASGVYPGCTDLAYEQAINDGTDIIDCSVQMTKDEVAFCFDSADLSAETTALLSFPTRSTTIHEIQKESGIFSFELTWSEIQTLKPQLASPFQQSGLKRNPANKNRGRFLTLSAFLELAQMKAVTGILIKIQNAAYLASNKGLNTTDAVATALSNATFDKQLTQKVLIQSDDSQVLSRFKGNRNYQKVLFISETISTAPNTTVSEIRKYADAVSVRRSSIVSSTGSFTKAFTSVVDNMHAANISVYVYLLRNEFVNMAFDYFSDPLVELDTYITSLGVDGVVTEYPATANAYLRSPCSNPKANTSYSISAVQPGSLLSLVPPEILPRVEAPAPALNVGDILDPPLPALSNASASAPAAVPPGKPHSGTVKNVGNLSFCLLTVLLLSLHPTGS